MLALVQSDFQKGRLEDDATWQMAVTTPKGGGEYRGICLVKVVCKIVTVILNHRFTASIAFQDALHGLRVGHRTCTASLKAKLLQQLAAMREAVLYTIFLDLNKAYDALDMDRCLDILEEYSIGLWDL